MSKPKVLEKFDKFVRDYDCSQYEHLPKFLKRRVDALKKLQLEHINIQHQYHKELQELELKYDKLYQPMYEKRFKIIRGEHEPTEDECQLPANIVDQDNGDQENSMAQNKPEFDEEDEKQLESKVKGLPGFWLGCLASTYNFNDSIEQHDRPVLKYLKDLRLSYAPEGNFLTYKLEFVFDENPYFSNEVLTKVYYLKSKPDEKDPFSYEGFEVVKSAGCEILWNPGKNVTVKTVTVKQQSKIDGRQREKKKEVERDSFFYFFKPPETCENNSNDETLIEEVSAFMAVDFELGEVIRQSIIPKAALYYTGYMLDEEDDGEDGDDDEDEDDYGDDEDEDDDDDDDDDDEEGLNHRGNSNNYSSSSESSDSLDTKQDKKSSNKKKSPKSEEKSA